MRDKDDISTKYAELDIRETRQACFSPIRSCPCAGNLCRSALPGMPPYFFLVELTANDLLGGAVGGRRHHCWRHDTKVSMFQVVWPWPLTWQHGSAQSGRIHVYDLVDPEHLPCGPLTTWRRVTGWSAACGALPRVWAPPTSSMAVRCTSPTAITCWSHRCHVLFAGLSRGVRASTRCRQLRLATLWRASAQCVVGLQ